MRRLGVRDLGLERVGRCGSTRKPKNLARNFYTQVVKDARVIPVKISKVPLRVRVTKPKVREIDMPYPVVTLSSWVSYLLRTSPKFVLGGYGLDEPEQYRRLFHKFWQRYQHVDPLHPVYRFFDECDWGQIVPWCLHGDEGRGLAKVPLLVTAFQFVIPVLGDQHTSISGHSFSTRFASTFIPAKMYAKNDATYRDYHEVLANDCDQLFFDGFTIDSDYGSDTFYFGFCGLKGDWPYIRKAAGLVTGFKSARMCHFCDDNEWWKLGTFSNLHAYDGCDLNGPLPWKGQPSPLRWVPGADNPAACRVDLAHTFAMGFGKDFCAGSLIALCHIGMFGGGAIATKLERAYAKFREWVHAAKETCKITEFSLKVFKVSSLQYFPVLAGQGHDCIVVCKWISEFLSTASRDDIEDGNRVVFDLVKWTADSANGFYRGLYKHGVWIPRNDVPALCAHGWGITEGYQALARACKNRRWKLYRMRPKCHMHEHIVRDLELQVASPSSHYAINPNCWICWQDEDYIGKVSRISRRTHPLTVAKRTFVRVLMKYKRLLR
eukprot:s3978_g5.t1